MNATIIGSGNMAWHLARALTEAGHTLHAIYGRSEGAASAIANQYKGALVTTSLDFSTSPSSLFFIAVRDEAIASVASEMLLPPNAVVVHTSGTVSIDVLRKHQNFGVFYLLQTFTKGKLISFREIPILLETSSAQTHHLLYSVATSLSDTILEATFEHRKQAHLAAVFACNFTNHLLGCAETLLKEQSIPIAILKPLVIETIEKGFLLGPAKAQTGPAIRGDKDTLNAHLSALETNPKLSAIYKLLSEQIVSMRGHI